MVRTPMLLAVVMLLSAGCGDDAAGAARSKGPRALQAAPVRPVAPRAEPSLLDAVTGVVVRVHDTGAAQLPGRQ